MAKVRIYYKASNGYLCNRLPIYLEPDEENDPFIEVDTDVYQETLCTDFDKVWAVINGELVNICAPELAEEAAIEHLRIHIEDNKNYLTTTDYIIIKIYEAQIMGDAQKVAELSSQYAEQLTLRKNLRAELDELEAQLADLEALKQNNQNND